MVNVIIDYKKNAIKSPCKICNKLILKGQRRIKVEAANNVYWHDYSYFHLSCFLEWCHSFVDLIPINELKI